MLLYAFLLILTLFAYPASAQTPTNGAVPFATGTVPGTVAPDPTCFTMTATTGKMTFNPACAGSGGGTVNPTLKITVNPGSADITWPTSNQYELVKFHNIAPNSTLNAALVDNGTDWGFQATRSGPIRITGQLWFVLPEMVALANAQYVVRWFKNGTASNPCSDGNGIVFSPDIGTAALVNGSTIWAWTVAIQGEDVATQGDMYRPCLYATLAGSGDYIDNLHSRFTFVEEGP